MIYPLYYGLDMFLRWVKLVRMRAQWSVVFFDCSYFDYYYQLGYRNAPRWYLKMIETLIPRPDLSIFLYRDSQDIYDQKPELTSEEICRQQKAIKECLVGRRNARIIDASNGIQDTAHQLCELIVAELFHRCRTNRGV